MDLPASRLSAKSSAYLTSKVRCSPALAPRRFSENSGIVFWPPISTMISSTSTGLESASCSLLSASLEASHGEVAVRQRTIFLHRGVGGMLIAQIVQRVLHVLIGDIGVDRGDADVIVGREFEFGQDLEGRFEFQRLAFVDVKVGNPGLRNRSQVLFLGFFAEVAGNQRVDDLALNIVSETLANHRGRNLAFAEARHARQLLIAVHDAFGFGFHYISRNLDGKFALAGIGLFGGTGVGSSCIGSQ